MGDVFLMGGLHRERRLTGIFARQADGQARHLVDEMEQVAAVYILLHDIGRISMCAGVEYRRYMWALHERGGLCSSNIRGHRVRRGQPVEFQDAQRHRVMEGRMKCLVSGAGRPLIHLVKDAIASDGQTAASTFTEFVGLVRRQPAAFLRVVRERIDVTPSGFRQARNSSIRTSSRSRTVRRASKNSLVVA